jgi:hypothetical protein
MAAHLTRSVFLGDLSGGFVLRVSSAAAEKPKE